MKTEQARAGEFLLSEAESDRSRTQVTVTGGSYEAGTVMGQLTADGKFTDLKTSGTDGNQNAAGVLYSRVDASAGDMQAVLIDLDAQVIDDLLVWPDGITAAKKDAAVTALLAKGIKVRSGAI
ncbi:hypothetical protein GZ77_09125 [Endozoicomonas montiporae]|uniref:Head decoration protein n=2 Tax=Endozoicomonas montiporae TaxID=1027273 RepID=A0A081N7S9_9GAMM|nr:head decoration protein [Endozoicomonas montiporae]AMO55635.1 bacteriophage lambda head decoration protein D [Endozoicomonas montiporae CL-33]KEQ14502.1 hypothetical protein GZ77_09125 [Endozoicomonas montiporae]